MFDIFQELRPSLQGLIISATGILVLVLCAAITIFPRFFAAAAAVITMCSSWFAATWIIAKAPAYREACIASAIVITSSCTIWFGVILIRSITDDDAPDSNRTRDTPTDTPGTVNRPQ